MKDGAPETITEGTIQPEMTEQEKKEEPVQTTTESDDEDFAADTQEMEEAAESDSESEDEENKANEDDVVEEDFAVEIKGGHIHKMKFEQMDQDSQEEEDVTEANENEAKLEMLSKTLPDQDDEDGDYNPCHDTLSDVDVDDDENDEESTPAVKKLDTLHKRTGAPLTEIEMNTDELKIPPADFVAQVATNDEQENAMEE